MLTGTHVATHDLVRLRARARTLILPTSPSVYRSGGFQSLIVGRGMEYEKSRRYDAGDDVRMIDWRVTARTGTAHTKVFQEDRQKAVYILTDLSSSMRFGTQVAFKSVVAAEAAAAIAWAACAQGDLVSIFGLVNDQVVHRKLAASAHQVIGQLDMLSGLSRHQPSPDDIVPLVDALMMIDKKARPGDLIFVLSDFFSLPDASASVLRLLSRRHSLGICWVQDQIEKTALPVGNYPISDGSEYAVLRLSSRSQRRKLQDALDERNERIDALLNHLQVLKVPLQCGDDVIRTLHRKLHQKLRSHWRQPPQKRTLTSQLGVRAGFQSKIS